MADNRIQQNTGKNESNDERDQDEGNMNNGTIGGDLNISNNSEDQSDNSRSLEGHGLKTVGPDTEGSSGNAGGSEAGK